MQKGKERPNYVLPGSNIETAQKMGTGSTFLKKSSSKKKQSEATSSNNNYYNQ